MKITKLFGLAFALLCVGTLASCGGNTNNTTTSSKPATTVTTPTTVAPTTKPTTVAPTTKPTTAPTTQTPTTGVQNGMSYSEYVAAELDDEVTISAYVQGKQSWWSNKATIYLQDENGGYFVYELPCTEEQYNTDLAIGNHIMVTGVKGEWAGQVEILGSEAGAEATYEVLEGNKVFEAKAMDSFDNEALLNVLNQKVSFAELTVVSVSLPAQDGGDIYFDVTNGVYTYTFCIEQYLTNSSTEVYQTALTLKAGDVIACEGFMYSYYGPQLHTTKITKANKNVLTKSNDALSYADYAKAELGSTVTIEAFVGGKQSWWSNKATIYLQDENGGYFVYELPCTEEQYNTDLAIGNKVKITGVKGEWAGQVEILGSEAGAEATFEALDGKWSAPLVDLTEFVADSAKLLEYLNQKVSFEGLEVASVSLPAQDGGDIYFDVKYGNSQYTFCIEQYLTDSSTEVYQTALNLKVGDFIYCEGFMYSYNGPQLHTTKIVVSQGDK